MRENEIEWTDYKSIIRILKEELDEIGIDLHSDNHIYVTKCDIYKDILIHPDFTFSEYLNTMKKATNTIYPKDVHQYSFHHNSWGFCRLKKKGEQFKKILTIYDKTEQLKSVHHIEISDNIMRIEANPSPWILKHQFSSNKNEYPLLSDLLDQKIVTDYLLDLITKYFNTGYQLNQNDDHDSL
ncbi:MAG: hypothetical protein HQ521_18765 [Bacteroidetes bacterium]|nr:hypothetical protein [Bacteroidota bacterium]